MGDRDAEDLDNIAKAFGLVVIQWGNCEQSLDMLVALLWQSLPTRDFARKIPFMLAPKLEFVRKSFAGRRLEASTRSGRIGFHRI